MIFEYLTRDGFFGKVTADNSAKAAEWLNDNGFDVVRMIQVG